MAWMYILECADGSYYVGSTKNLERRMAEHLSGLGSRYTSGRHLHPPQVRCCQSSLFTVKSTTEFLMLIIVRSRCKIGAEPNGKH